MATRIRLARGGSKKRPFYRLVIADKRSPRDGNFIEKVGTYNPLLASDNAERFTFDKERIEHWLKTGATPSEKVAIFLWDNGFKTVEKYLPNAFPKSADERTKLRQKRLDAEKQKAEEAQKKIDDAKKQAEEEAKAAAKEAAAAEKEKAAEEAKAKAEEVKAEEAKPEKAPAEPEKAAS